MFSLKLSPELASLPLTVKSKRDFRPAKIAVFLSIMSETVPR